jgi:2'-5' RNA ligase
MRLFTGLDLAAPVVRELERLTARLRPTARIHWIPPANLHLTTKFVGEWPDERLGDLRAALDRVARPAPFEIAVRRVGFFPNPHHPRVFWCGLEAPPELAALARATEDALAALGVPREDRAFSPHLTLARIKEPVNLEALREAIATLPSLDFGAFTARCFYLYQSRLQPSGAVYTKLAEFAFGT